MRLYPNRYLSDLVLGSGPSPKFFSARDRESNMAIGAVGKNERSKIHHYKVEVRTELSKKEIVSVTAVDEQDAEDLVLSLVMKGGLGLKGGICTYNVVVNEE